MKEHVVRTREKRNEYKISVGKHEGNRPLGKRRRWLKMILERMRGCGLDTCGSGYVPMGGSCEQGNKSSDSIRGGEFSELD
jgi:hypothetical protein